MESKANCKEAASQKPSNTMVSIALKENKEETGHHPCENCSKSFKTRSGLSKHIKKHITEESQLSEFAKKLLDYRWKLYKIKEHAKKLTSQIIELESETNPDSKSSIN